MISIKGLNHITLAVSDLKRSVTFYQNALGMDVRYHKGNTAYLEAGVLWLCLSYDPECRSEPYKDYTHTAFDVAEADFETIKQQIIDTGGKEWRSNKSEGDSFYFLDPDDHKLEIHVGNLQSRLAAYAAKN